MSDNQVEAHAATAIFVTVMVADGGVPIDAEITWLAQVHNSHPMFAGLTGDAHSQALGDALDELGERPMNDALSDWAKKISPKHRLSVYELATELSFIEGGSLELSPHKDEVCDVLKSELGISDSDSERVVRREVVAAHTRHFQSRREEGASKKRFGGCGLMLIVGIAVVVGGGWWASTLLPHSVHRPQESNLQVAEPPNGQQSPSRPADEESPTSVPNPLENLELAAGYFRNPATGHVYLYVEMAGLSWQQARDAANEIDLGGSAGYLATITSREEWDFIRSNVFTSPQDVIYLGATDAGSEGDWRWVTGPEGAMDVGRGLLFWRGDANGTLQNSLFALWQPTAFQFGGPFDVEEADYLTMFSYYEPEFSTTRGDMDGASPASGGAAGFLVEFGGSDRYVGSPTP